jgi:molybdate/tungstate transport system ATP-binding protein
MTVPTAIRFNEGVILLEWPSANGIILRLPHRPELAAGQSVQWMITPTAVRLPSLKPELHRCSDNAVTAVVESRLNMGTHFQVALRCGTDRLWLTAQASLLRHHGMEAGREITVCLRSDGLVCWPQLD